jgi:predicted amidohydrolase
VKGDRNRVALCQTRPRLGEREANLGLIEEAARSVAADLYIFPELATTGYAFEGREALRDLAESPRGGPGLDLLQELAEALGAGLVCGLPLVEGNRLYNAAVLARPGAEPVFYRKLHLFYREKDLFDPGEAPPPVTPVGNLRVGMMICFDWIFPETARLLALAGADLIAHPANLVLDLCQKAMVTRSIENGLYTATVNRIGAERYADGETLAFTGRSQLLNPKGRCLLRFPAEKTAVRCANIDPAAARAKQVTGRNHALADRRPEHYGALLDPPAEGGPQTEVGDDDA